MLDAGAGKTPRCAATAHQSDLVAARARRRARQTCARTEVRAPFEGRGQRARSRWWRHRADRQGTGEVIDPRSMRFEGQPGLGRPHPRAEARPEVPPSASTASTPGAVHRRKVGASTPPPTPPRAGWTVIFDRPAEARAWLACIAEGRVETGTRTVLTVPEASWCATASRPLGIDALQGERLGRVPVNLGERDERSGVPDALGLAEGDRILRNPGSNLTDGQGVRVRRHRRGRRGVGQWPASDGSEGDGDDPVRLQRPPAGGHRGHHHRAHGAGPCWRFRSCASTRSPTSSSRCWW